MLMSEKKANDLPEAGTPASPARFSPVWQFVLLIVPIVMNGFFTVYALTGWLVDGQYRINWSIEAPNVALYVGTGMTLFCILVLFLLRWRGLPWNHPLGLSSMAHAALALLLATLIASVVRG